MSDLDYRIQDDDHANRKLWKVTRDRIEIDRLKAEGAAAIAEAKEWLAEVTGPVQARIDRNIGLLVDYRHRLEADDPALPKTYRLRRGDLTRRQQPEKVAVTDVEEFHAWCVANGHRDLVRVTVEVDKAALLRLPFPHIDQGDGTAILETDNGAVPGVVLVRDEDRYGVTTPKTLALLAVEDIEPDEMDGAA